MSKRHYLLEPSSTPSRARVRAQLIKLINDHVAMIGGSDPVSIWEIESSQYSIRSWKKKLDKIPTQAAWKDDGRYVCHVEIPEVITYD